MSRCFGYSTGGVAEKREGCLVNRETGRRIAAVLPVHVFGHPAPVDQLRSVADFWGLPLVEDAAEALASWRGEKHCGLFGSVGILSFNGNKLITTGGGGALLTNDSVLAQRARHLSTTAKQPHPWDFNHDLGWNDRMPYQCCTRRCPADLDRRLDAKRLLAHRYAEAFSDLDGVELVLEPRLPQPLAFGLRFTSEDILVAQSMRLQLLKAAHAVGLLLRPIWTPLHHLPMYESCPAGPLPVAAGQAPFS